MGKSPAPPRQAAETLVADIHTPPLVTWYALQGVIRPPVQSLSIPCLSPSNLPQIRPLPVFDCAGQNLNFDTNFVGDCAIKIRLQVNFLARPPLIALDGTPDLFSACKAISGGGRIPCRPYLHGLIFTDISMFLAVR